MLEHAAEPAHTVERMGETTAVVSDLVPVPCLIDVRQLTPPRARRMCHDRMGPVVVPGVAMDIPRVDAGEVEVHPVRLDVERRNHDGQFADTKPASVALKL